jgi:hypothetical protein
MTSVHLQLPQSPKNTYNPPKKKAFPKKQQSKQKQKEKEKEKDRNIRKNVKRQPQPPAKPKPKPTRPLNTWFSIQRQQQ